MDFFKIEVRETRSGREIYPNWRVLRSNDLMVRGKSFYAIWDAERGLWSTDEYDVQRLVDKELMEYRDRIAKKTDVPISVKLMADFTGRAWSQYRAYINQLSDNSNQLDEQLTFANTEVKKKDYVSKRLPYSLEAGDISAYDKLVSTLYSPEEREKIEWAIGAIVAGDAKNIQKFLVLYGEGGTGKSTMLNIIQKLFSGYYTVFEAKALTSSNNAFSTEVFRSNPLVAIQHDGDLSHIEDNTKLNSIISHEEIALNEKYKPTYMARVNAFLFMATNRPVKITDAKSGIIRRLIDVRPSGEKVPTVEYHSLVNRIDFELGAIAHHCLEVYRSTGKNYYSNYRPMGMILQTDVFFNFVEDIYFTLVEEDGISLTQAYALYKKYCEDSLVDYKLARHKFREELKNYFHEFSDITRIDGKQVRSYYSKFKKDKFSSGEKETDLSSASWIILDQEESIFESYDSIANASAQYANSKGIPVKKWSSVKTVLSDLDTSKLHYVKLPQNHIVIDFDIKNVDGEKSPEENIKAASKWPPTYAEFSKSQAGIHLHYIYEGDVSKLSRIYGEGIEIKVFTGDASLRRKLTKCNKIPIATINSGLPEKEYKVINSDTVKSEKALRDLIGRNLRKEIHPATKPSIDFIYVILEEAYNSGLSYDINDMAPAVLHFANNSSNNAKYCLGQVSKMKFASESPSEDLADYSEEEKLIFYDVEVFPNLLWISWKIEGEDTCFHMVNPSSLEIEELLRRKLVGFNCRRYDNHILYGRLIGYNNEEIFALSEKIIGGSGRNGLFSEAYKISYADVFDFASKKQSLKKWQIELGIQHLEFHFPFDEPIDKSNWDLVGQYCDNDVRSTEAVFKNRQEDFIARQILSAISGLRINDTTRQHTARIIFGLNKNPQNAFVYTDLSEQFPGYRFDAGKSYYRGEIPGEGGYVYAEPGYYENVALLDVESMHPTSIEILNLFGPYTEKFSRLKAARLAIKHKDLAKARELLPDVDPKYISSLENAEPLAYALKIVINIVYGLTSATFDNEFRDSRNKDNIVAKRGALFMIDLKNAVQERGWNVAHIKTDSIKIPNANKEMIDFVINFGKDYGYTFKLEATYKKFCLVNEAVYIAYDDDGWHATGAQFAHPYVFKTLFSKEPIEFEDLCETKSVNTNMYIDLNEGLPEGEHNYVFVGKAGNFCPVIPGAGGGALYRIQGERYHAVTGTKDYLWMESEVAKINKKEKFIDYRYFRKLADDAIKTINKYVDFDVFQLDN